MADKKKKTAADGGAADEQSSVKLWIGRARAASALLGFAVATWVARGEGLPWTDSLLRGLIAAIAFSIVGWWCGLLVIQALLRTAAHKRNQAAREAALAMQPGRPESSSAAPERVEQR